MDAEGGPGHWAAVVPRVAPLRKTHSQPQPGTVPEGTFRNQVLFREQPSLVSGEELA